MNKKKDSRIPALPGKEYFLKNPDGFLFTHLFASVSIQERLSSLVKEDASITPVSLHIAPARHIRSFGSSMCILSSFTGNVSGEAYTFFPVLPIKNAAKAAGTTPAELLLQLFEPVASNMHEIAGSADSEVSVACHIAHAKALPDGGGELSLWVKYHVEISGSAGFFGVQYLSTDLLLSLSRHFPGTSVAADAAADSGKFLAFVRDLNRQYQKRLVESIEAGAVGKVTLGDETAAEEASVNLEELRFADDRTIREILEELSRKRFPARSLVHALSGMSGELQRRFLQNMSRNRRAEIREGLSLWCGTDDEILQAQRDLAWIIIDLVESGEVKVSKRMQAQLGAIITAMDAALRKSAEEYLSSNTFGTSLTAINGILIQLLIRRIPRKILIPAVANSGDNVLSLIRENMTPFSLNLLMEDIAHWRRKTQDETEKICAAAASQKTIIRTAIKLKREFARSAF